MSNEDIPTNNIEQNSQEDTVEETPIAPVIEGEITETSIENPSNTVTVWYKYAFLAASAVILVLVGLVMVGRNKNNKLELDYKVADNQLKAVQDTLVMVTNEHEKQLKKMLAIQNLITDNQTEKVVLKGAAKNPEATASVYWNSRWQRALMTHHTLPTLSDTTQQYQLWAVVENAPVSLGVITNQKYRVYPVEIQNKPVASFAVTIEPKGGSVQPSVHNIVLIGR